jgi:hypothetical protein
MGQKSRTGERPGYPYIYKCVCARGHDMYICSYEPIEHKTILLADTFNELCTERKGGKRVKHILEV